MDTELENRAEQQVTADMRQEIDDTRSAMADKMGALQGRVMDTVQNAQETVEDSIQIANDTMTSVKHAFDIKYQVAQHPWAMVSGSILAGLALGSLIQSVRRRTRQNPDRPAGNETARPSPPQGDEGRLGRPRSDLFSIPLRGNGSSDDAALPRFDAAPPPSRPGAFGRYQEEIDKVRGVAIGYIMGLVRDSIKEAVPQVASQIDCVMDGITIKLGGEPIHLQSK